MALKNVRKKQVTWSGTLTWELKDRAGVPISVFSEFCRKLTGLAYATQLRYTTVVARFIDYLYEVEVLGGPPVSRAVLNKAIDHYLALLRSGENISLSVGEGANACYAEGDQASELALRNVAKRLGIEPLSSGSWDNTLAPLNMFLRVCAMLEQEAKEIAVLKGGIDASLVNAAEWDYRPLLQAVDGISAFSVEEVWHLKHSTMLGGVIRFRGNKLTRPKGLKQSSRQKSQVDVDSLDFPEDYFPALLQSTTSWRDRALWTLLLASGIRRSEALNLRWCDVDFAAREVYVLDPNQQRYGRLVPTDVRQLRFKGRSVSQTYMRLPYRNWFFEYLSRYRREEYRLPMDGNDFVFQYLFATYHGRPLHKATDETLNDSFKSAVKRARIPGPAINRNYVWTAHSLRHAYARHMLNDFNVPGQERPGLSEVDVQALLGQKHIGSTRKYAKPHASRLREKLLAHDHQYIQGIVSLPGQTPQLKNAN
ncbi:tyrosine-type recombinase/integrase [Massilia sp. WF1]|uniref:tyrosine-type recombinase/integrase n=1 Tax=Massilia sp. WF1 TaxID=1406431 RepID=UPI0009FE3EB3|nr:tyrosine-type recombinase/integrase [Massilia sp. WF1]